MAISKLTPLALAVLELLHERPMHPYEMTQLMRQRYVHTRVKVKAGSLYHTVERLLTSDYIEVVDTQQDGRRPERTVYGMTEAGRDAFTERAKAMLATPAEEYPEYLSGLAVLDELGPEVALEELRRRAVTLEAEVAAAEVIRQSLTERQLPEVFWMDWSYRTAHKRFELDWTRRLIADIESGRLTFQKSAPRGAPLSLLTTEGPLTTKERHDPQAS